MAGSARQISSVPDLPSQVPGLGHRSGVLRSVLEALAEDLRVRGKLDLSECFIEGTFVAAKKGGLDVGCTKRGKGCKIMASADSQGFPLSIHIASVLSAYG